MAYIVDTFYLGMWGKKMLKKLAINNVHDVGDLLFLADKCA
jgi:hypothetical protein